MCGAVSFACSLILNGVREDSENLDFSRHLKKGGMYMEQVHKQKILKWMVLPLVLLGIVLMSGTAPAGQENEAGQSPVLQRIMNSGVLRVGVNPLFKPFSFQDKNGNRVGVDVDVAGLLAKKLGVKLEVVVPGSFGELIPMLTGNKIDLIAAGMSITFKRAKVIDFTEPYFYTGLSILLNKASSARLGISAVPDYQAMLRELGQNGKLSRLKIAVTRGKAPQQVVPRFFPGAKVIAYPSNEEAAAATLEGEADIMVHDEIFLKVWLKEHAGEAKFRLTVLDPPFKPDFYAMAIAKGNQEFLNMLNVFILELQANSQLEQFMGRYLPVKAKVITRSYNINEDYYGGD
jgi:polar amino acid transport system substrate-binding protein